MLIRVLEIPPPTGNMHFGKNNGEPQTFIEVDWFRDDPLDGVQHMFTEEGRERIAKFIRDKKYFDPEKAYLVLHQEHTFTINYKAP